MKRKFGKALSLCLAVSMIFAVISSLYVSAAETEIWQAPGALTGGEAVQMFKGITITPAEDNKKSSGATVEGIVFNQSFQGSNNASVTKSGDEITMEGAAYKIETERSGYLAFASTLGNTKGACAKSASDFDNYLLNYKNDTGADVATLYGFNVTAGETYYFWFTGTKPRVYGATFKEINAVSMPAGETVLVKAIPNDNALIGNVRIDDENVTLNRGEGMKETTFTMPSNDVTVNVDFVSSAVVSEVESLSFDTIKGSNTSENEVYDSLELFDGWQTSIGYADVSWQSSNTDIISVSGEVNPDAVNTQVDVTAVFSYQDYPNIFLYKTFHLTVPADTDDEGAVQAAKENLTLGDTSAVKKNLELPVKGRRNTTITWSSSNPAVVAADGTVNPKFDEDTTVTLTATITRGNAFATKEFTVIVPGIVPISFERAAISNENGDVVITPSDGDYLSHIVYTNSIANLTGNETIVASADGKEVSFNIKEYSEKSECQNGDETIIYLDKTDLPVGADSVITITAYENSDKTAPLPQGEYTYSAEIAENPTIYVAGDSTACTYAATGNNNRFPQTGWAAVLGDYFSGAKVNDLALSGRSSLSFLKEGNYTTIKNNIKTGDYFIVQFGHNDSKVGEADRYTDPKGDRFTDGSYKKNLMDNYVNIALDKGAYPLLTTSISRRKTSDSSLEAYVNATKELGKELGLPVIDLYGKTNGYINRVGAEKAKDIFNYVKAKDSRFVNCAAGEFTKSQYYAAGTTDDTHINYFGAQMVSQWFCDELSRISHPLTSKRNSFVMTESDVPSYADAAAAANLSLSTMADGDEYSVIYDFDSSLGTVEISVGEAPTPSPTPDVDDPTPTPTTHPTDPPEPTATPKAGKVTVNGSSITATSTKVLDLYAVKYDEEGIITNIKVFKVDLTAQFDDIGFAPDKVFLWDKNQIPVDSWTKE